VAPVSTYCTGKYRIEYTVFVACQNFQKTQFEIIVKNFILIVSSDLNCGNFRQEKLKRLYEYKPKIRAGATSG
jgi:hypothetical protein